MDFIKEFKRSGQWLFKWRSYLPLVMILPFVFLLRKFSYPGGSHSLDKLWETVCYSISFLGFAIRIYIVGHKPEGTSGRNTKAQKANSLNTTGMYSIIRHPLYFGNFLIWLGILLFVHNLAFSVIAILIYFLYYERIIFVEEEFLHEKFGQVFDEWAQKTPVIFPRF